MTQRRFPRLFGPGISGIMLAATSWTTTAQAACPANLTAVRATLDQTLRTYDDWAWDKFKAEVTGLEEEIGCITQVLNPTDAGRIHLIMGLNAGLNQREQDAMRSFQALLWVNPEFLPTDDQMAPGSLLRSAFETAQQTPSTLVKPLLLDTETTWAIDGQRGAGSLPVDRAVIVQKLQSNEVQSSWYVVDHPLPDALASQMKLGEETSPAVAPESLASSATRVSRTGHGSRNLAIGAGAVALGSGLALAKAKLTHDAFLLEADDESADTLMKQNHWAAGAGYGMGAVAGGLVVAAIVHGNW